MWVTIPQNQLGGSKAPFSDADDIVGEIDELRIEAWKFHAPIRPWVHHVRDIRRGDMGDGLRAHLLCDCPHHRQRHDCHHQRHNPRPLRHCDWTKTATAAPTLRCAAMRLLSSPVSGMREVLDMVLAVYAILYANCLMKSVWTEAFETELVSDN